LHANNHQPPARTHTAKLVLIMSTRRIIKFPPLMHNLPFYRAIWLKVSGPSSTSAKLKIVQNFSPVIERDVELINGTRTRLRFGTLRQPAAAISGFQDALSPDKCLASWFAKCCGALSLARSVCRGYSYCISWRASSTSSNSTLVPLVWMCVF
jgi:hypothetical protein